MFETSLLPQRRGKDARLVRWIAFGSIALQLVVVVTLILIPLVHPDTLPSVIHPARMTHVELVRPEPKPVPVKVQAVAATNAAAMTAPAHFVPAVIEARRGGMISRAPVTDDAPLLALGGGKVMGGGFNAAVGGGAPNGGGNGPIVVEARPVAAAQGPLRVSSGVSRGLLIDPIRPVYPTIAKAARQQGTVVVTAVIDRSGRIVNAQVVNGPEMLRDAAITAVREARYRPYLLNGQPTEVVTTFSITFTMNG